MMTQNTKTKGVAWKVLLTIPVMAALIVVNSKATASDNRLEETTTTIENSISMQPQQITLLPQEEKALTIVDVMPEFPGGLDALINYLSTNIKYPQEALDNNITGQVIIQFIIEKDGSVSNVTALRDLGFGTGAEGIRVVKAMPKWTPGKQDGKVVRVSYNLPISFAAKQDNAESEDEIHSIVEQMPEFPGGLDALSQYLMDNLTYPQEALDQNITGRVIVNFVIEADGRLSNIKALSELGGGCTEAAIEAVKKMPKWKPGIDGGKAVKVTYSLPIRFEK